MLEIDIPSSVSIKTISKSKLPLGWHVFPHLIETQKIGDDFVGAGSHCILKVPSAVVEGDFSYLINAAHSDFSKIKINSVSDFPIDRRLLK